MFNHLNISSTLEYRLSVFEFVGFVLQHVRDVGHTLPKSHHRRRVVQLLHLNVENANCASDRQAVF